MNILERLRLRWINGDPFCRIVNILGYGGMAIINEVAWMYFTPLTTIGRSALIFGSMVSLVFSLASTLQTPQR